MVACRRLYIYPGQHVAGHIYNERDFVNSSVVIMEREDYPLKASAGGT
jgi:hypothetical protein